MCIRDRIKLDLINNINILNEMKVFK